jgi:hypothetical protein
MALAAVRARVIQIISEQQLRLTADQAAKRADEYIKFMQLKAELRAEHLNAYLAPSHAIDQVWRSHMVDTRSYQQLQTLIDGGSVHYNPGLMEKSFHEECYASTLSFLLQRYGTLDTDSWPIVNLSTES